MRNWKNWLLPILTCLTVAALALLPLRLSALRDGALTGAVHTEPLAGDSNFPFRPPDLPGRIWLLSQWQQLPENLTIMGQSLEAGSFEWDDALALAGRALKSLEELGAAGTALAESVGENPIGFTAERLYLRDQEDLSSASFLSCNWYGKESGHYFNMVLDAETDEILHLELGMPEADMPASAEVGGRFLDRLGLSWEAADSVDSLTSFRLSDSRRNLFLCFVSPNEMLLQFTVDWSAVASPQAVNEAMGIVDNSDGGYDAVPMQKRGRRDAEKRRFRRGQAL